jgi:D,D-heptose 1,7-bisphosphate phosphatase
MGVSSNSRQLGKRKAIFLDRDGTIIHHVHLMHKVQDLKFFKDSALVIKSFNRLGFLVVIITNQPVVARGLVTKKEVDEIHAVLIDRLKTKGARIDAVYFCPHHPEANLKRYRLVCACRKPKPGLLLKAISKFNIDPRQSYMIGDSMIDIVAGKKSRLRTILVQTGPGHVLDKKYQKIKVDFKVKNLESALKIIKQHES